MLVEELLEKMVGKGNVSRHYFRFMRHVNKLPRLKLYVTAVNGESTITNAEGFIRNLKRYVDRREIKARKIVEGVKMLEISNEQT